jgi:hypothetical protein
MRRTAGELLRKGNQINSVPPLELTFANPVLLSVMISAKTHGPPV